MKIKSVEDLGLLIRNKRKLDGLTLANAASLCGVSYVFLSELENGKSTVQFDKVLQVIGCLGIDIIATSRNWQTWGTNNKNLSNNHFQNISENDGNDKIAGLVSQESATPGSIKHLKKLLSKLENDGNDKVARLVSQDVTKLSQNKQIENLEGFDISRIKKVSLGKKTESPLENETEGV